jgi:hypothetical protein
LETHLDTVCTEVALFCHSRIWIQIKRVIWASLQARGAPNAGLTIQVHNAILAFAQSVHWANLHARGVVAMIAAHDTEVAARIRELPHFNILHPSAETAHRHIIFRFANHSAGVTANALSLVNDKSVGSHTPPSLGLR